MRACVRYLRGCCENKGYQVATADNGFDALLKLKEVVIPDVIISDLNMPKMSGFEFLSVVRRRFPEISVIASAEPMEAQRYPRECLPMLFLPRESSRVKRC
jgi:CheY-like chemotaxis protein